MSIKHLNELSRRMPNKSTSHTLANIPIPPPKCDRPSVQRIPPHGRALHRPFRKDGQTPAQDARKVEFGMGEDVCGFVREVFKVCMDPNFLEDDDGVRRGGDAVGDGIKPGCPVFGNVFQTPTVSAEGGGKANQQFRERTEITESWSGDAMSTRAEEAEQMSKDALVFDVAP
jgi:hypothetical protein